MIKDFEPILKDLDIDFAKNNKAFRNEAREKAWGKIVMFFPPNQPLGVNGCGGYGYNYGHTCPEEGSLEWNKKDKDGNWLYRYGNCTWLCGALYFWRTGIILKELIGPAWKTFDKFDGRKDGGELNNEYIGATIQKGDMLCFVDNLNKTGDGHIASVEDEDETLLYIVESGWSRQKPYIGKTCIAYTLKKSDMFTGKKVSLRPQQPYSEYVYGVIHTGDVFDREDKKSALEKENKALKEKIAKIKELCD